MYRTTHGFNQVETLDGSCHIKTISSPRQVGVCPAEQQCSQAALFLTRAVVFAHELCTVQHHKLYCSEHRNIKTLKNIKGCSLDGRVQHLLLLAAVHGQLTDDLVRL